MPASGKHHQSGASAAVLRLLGGTRWAPGSVASGRGASGWARMPTLPRTSKRRLRPEDPAWPPPPRPGAFFLVDVDDATRKGDSSPEPQDDGTINWPARLAYLALAFSPAVLAARLPASLSRLRLLRLGSLRAADRTLRRLCSS